MKRKISILICAAVALSIFSGCTANFNIGSAEIKYKIEDGRATVTELPNKTTITSIEIPDEYEGIPVTEIADFAGCNLENVEFISIGKNVEKIGVWAFANNQKLKAFSVSEENKEFCSVDGVLFTKDVKTLLFYPNSRSNEYKIPDSVETLRAKSFYKCSSLEKLTLSENLKRIEDKVFFRCGSLNDITLPEKLEFIGMDAFGYCSQLTKITVPAYVRQIDEYAFYNCDKLLEVKMKCDKDNVKLGKNWYPTNNGLNIDELNIIWEQ